MTIRMNSVFPYMADYLDIMPKPPLGEEEKRVLDELSEIVKRYDIVFVTPKAYNANDLLWLCGAGERENRTNVMTFEFSKARNAGKPVMYMDTEASFDPSWLDK
jgi:hypothetical protein